MKDELNPCSVCGEAGSAVFRHKRIPFVECRLCGHEEAGKTEGEAITAWNSRYVDAGIPQGRFDAPFETPSPDVMEVWREAQKIWIKDATSPSVNHSMADQAAASVIAEAKARWEREALGRAEIELPKLTEAAAENTSLRAELLEQAKANGAGAEREAKLMAERDEAIRECTKWAREAGEAKGRLEGSELPGIVDGWREKCEALEHMCERLREALVMFISKVDNAGAVLAAWPVIAKTKTDPAFVEFVSGVAVASKQARAVLEGDEG